MLLFSTLLDVNETLTKTSFIELVIEWVQSSPHIENVIPNIVWDGSSEAHFGDEKLWLDITEYRNENTVAVRFEKIEEDGRIWDSDYVLNLNERRLSIQLNRSYRENAESRDPRFSTPYIISMLIEKGFLQDDSYLPITKEPIYIDEKNTKILADIIKHKETYKLPIVYVSKTFDNKFPINVKKLANKLKGAAHVLVQSDISSSHIIRKSCDSKNEYGGAVGIYYPSPSNKHIRFLFDKFSNRSDLLIERIQREVISYANSCEMKSLYTWEGVSVALLKDRVDSQKLKRKTAENAKTYAEQEREKVQNEFDVYIDEFDSEKTELQGELINAKSRLISAQNEIQALRTRLENMDIQPLIIYGDEEEFFEGEFKEIVLDAIKSALPNVPQNSRRADVLQNIIEFNPNPAAMKKRKEMIKNALAKGDFEKTVVWQKLAEIGIQKKRGDTHNVCMYYGDSRYIITLPKTPSDFRSIKNLVSEIVNLIL